MSKNVIVLGASHKPERYSYKAVELLREKGYNPIPVHPRGIPVSGIPARVSLHEVEEEVDTISVYVNKNISLPMKDEIIKLKPRRVILNPGAENKPLAAELGRQGIQAVEACTLVLLKTGQF